MEFVIGDYLVELNVWLVIWLVGFIVSAVPMVLATEWLANRMNRRGLYFKPGAVAIVGFGTAACWPVAASLIAVDIMCAPLYIVAWIVWKRVSRQFA